MKDTILLLHGALGSKTQLTNLAAKLQETHDVHCFNFEGHGGEESQNPFSIQLFTENVIDYLRINGISSTTIFGYSMGGYVALNLAKKQPSLVNKIITLGTKFDWSVESAEKEVRMLNPSKIEEKIPQFAEYLNQLHQPQDWRAVMTKTSDMMLAMANGAKLFDTDFKNIHTPVVIGLGSEDNMVSYDESAYVVGLIPNATFVTLPGVKHPIDQVELSTLVAYVMGNLRLVI